MCITYCEFTRAAREPAHNKGSGTMPEKVRHTWCTVSYYSQMTKEVYINVSDNYPSSKIPGRPKL